MSGLPHGVQVQPIDSITPFLNGRWWIKARVTDKSDIRTWKKPSSEGKLFSCTLVDQSSAIRATVFQEAVDQLFPMLQPGGVFYFSGGQVKGANRKFSNVNNDYELTFDKNTQVIPAPRGEDESSIPIQRYNFVPIQILKQRDVGSLVDVLAVVLQTGEVGNIVQKATGKELTKRIIKIADATAAIELTLWDEGAKMWNIPTGSIVAFRQCRTGSYDGVTLGTTQQSTFDLNPRIPDTAKLAEWFHATGGSDVASLSNQGLSKGGGDFENFKGRRFFDDIAAEQLGRGVKPDFIDVRCTPVYLKTDGQWYDACPTPMCGKKVTPVGVSNQSKCEKCDKIVVPVQRYLVSLQASDNVSQVWLTMFNDTAEEFLGISAAELKQRSASDPAVITKIAQSRLHRPLLMRIRVKEERNGGADGDDRMRLTVTKVTEILSSERSADEKEKRPAQGKISDEVSHLLDCIKAY